jgi:hypothetical protein
MLSTKRPDGTYPTVAEVCRDLGFAPTFATNEPDNRYTWANTDTVEGIARATDADGRPFMSCGGTALFHLLLTKRHTCAAVCYIVLDDGKLRLAWSC